MATPYQGNPVERPGPEAIEVMQALVDDLDKSDEAGFPRAVGEWAHLRLHSALSRVGKAKLQQVFRGALVYFSPSPADRRLLERAAREFSKRRFSVPYGDRANKLHGRKRREYREYLGALKRTLQGSERRTAEPKAEGLQVVNTGGFDAQTMQASEQVVAEASKLLRDKGFGQVLYGPVYVTNTLTKRKLLAFYDATTDEVYLRANIRGEMGPALATVIHELAHRFDRMFLKDSPGLRMLYETTAAKTRELHAQMRERIRTGTLPVELPAAGQPIEIGDKRFVVRDVQLRPKRRIYLDRLDKEGNIVRGRRLVSYISVETYIEMVTGSTTSAFVSEYSKKNAGENFAEMVAAYCMNKFKPDDWRAAYLQALCGLAPPATDPTGPTGVVRLSEDRYRVTYEDLPTVYLAERAGPGWELRQTASPWSEPADFRRAMTVGPTRPSIEACLAEVNRIFEAGRAEAAAT